MITIAITNGPSKDQLYRSFEQCSSKTAVSVTFHTKKRSFTGVINALEHGISDDDFRFIGIFNGVALRGRYFAQTRTGQIEIRPAGADEDNKTSLSQFIDFFRPCL